MTKKINVDPQKCSMLDCNRPLGPDALEFSHKGESAGGICERCIEGTPKLKVLFVLNAETEQYEPEEMVALG